MLSKQKTHGVFEGFLIAHDMICSYYMLAVRMDLLFYNGKAKGMPKDTI